MLSALILVSALVSADMPLSDPMDEKRAQALMYEIRCVACENEPISHSAAEIAIDMRRAVRNQIRQGSSDAEIRQWFAQRYGDFVLFRPPMRGSAMALWLFPFVLLGLAIIGAGLFFRRGSNKIQPPP